MPSSRENLRLFEANSVAGINLHQGNTSFRSRVNLALPEIHLPQRETQPSVRLLWTPSRRSSVWASVSRAVRTPSYFELDSELNLAAFPTPGGLPAIARLQGSTGIPSETLRAHEAGYRRMNRHGDVVLRRELAEPTGELVIHPEPTLEVDLARREPAREQCLDRCFG